jgi:DNA polymerase-3 subunit epsilon
MKLIRPIVFFDLETTGTDIVNSRIVQLAYIKLYMDGTTEENKFLVNPIIPIPKEASDVHGITDDMVKDAPFFSNIAKTIYEVFKNSDIAGYNSNNFDIPLICEEYARLSVIFLDWEYNLIDVLKYERLLRPNKLADVYKRYTGKELEGSHDALNDTRATLQILFHQIDGKDEITAKEIDDFCQGSKKRYDVSGKTHIDENGIVCWSFGKLINKPVLEDKKYLDWVLSNDFPSETKFKINQLLKK